MRSAAEQFLVTQLESRKFADGSDGRTRGATVGRGHAGLCGSWLIHLPIFRRRFRR